MGSSSGEDPNPSDGLSAKSGSLPGYDGPVAWAMGHYTVELDWEHSADGQGGRLTFYLVRDENGETTRIPFQRLPEDYGPDLRYPYPSSVAARPFSGVLGQEGFVLTYALGSESVPTEYYALDGDGAFQLLLSCDGQVWELDLDNDGDAELLECPYGADGEARVYDWISVGGLSLEQGGPGQVAVADVNHAAARKLGFIQGGVGLEYLPPEGGSKPGDPMGFRCFAQLNDMGTPAGNAVPTDRTLSLSWDELNGFQAPSPRLPPTKAPSGPPTRTAWTGTAAPSGGTTRMARATVWTSPSTSRLTSASMSWAPAATNTGPRILWATWCCWTTSPCWTAPPTTA